MKRYISTFIMLSLMAVMMPFASATTAEASVVTQSRCYNSRTGKYYLCKKPNFYRRHRKFINIAAGTGAGMVLGAMLGGRKEGAAIGALAGAGGGYLVTKKQKPKNHVRYYRRY